MEARGNARRAPVLGESPLDEVMNPNRQRVLADTLERVLSESELADLRVLIHAAGHWADQLIDHIAPGFERLREFDRAYAEREDALHIGNALNRFVAVGE